MFCSLNTHKLDTFVKTSELFFYVNKKLLVDFEDQS